MFGGILPPDSIHRLAKVQVSFAFVELVRTSNSRFIRGSDGAVESLASVKLNSPSDLGCYQRGRRVWYLPWANSSSEMHDGPGDRLNRI